MAKVQIKSEKLTPFGGIRTFATRSKGSLKLCKIRSVKELRSFPIRSPFCLFRYQTSTSQAFTSRKMILCGDL